MFQNIVLWTAAFVLVCQQHKVILFYIFTIIIILMCFHKGARSTSAHLTLYGPRQLARNRSFFTSTGCTQEILTAFQSVSFEMSSMAILEAMVSVFEWDCINTVNCCFVYKHILYIKNSVQQLQTTVSTLHIGQMLLSVRPLSHSNQPTNHSL